MPLVAELELPTFPGAAPHAAPALRWIATDFPPYRTQEWPLLMPPPPGWHEVSDAQAATLRKPGFVSISFLPDPPPTTRESEAAALSTAAPSLAAVAARRRSRVPREPRLPRSPRPARTVRASRLFRAERAPRRPRYPRRPRRARRVRPPRTPRPKAYKTKQPPGICKGPGCTCWTPAGCAPPEYIGVFGDFTKTDCYRGPCYSYEACVSEKCQVHAACAINQILIFWARQYQAVAAYVEPVTTPVLAAARIVARALPAIGLLQVIGEELQAPPTPAGMSCGELGWIWQITTIGCRCGPPGTFGPPATHAQLVLCGILPA